MPNLKTIAVLSSDSFSDSSSDSSSDSVRRRLY